MKINPTTIIYILIGCTLLVLIGLGVYSFFNESDGEDDSNVRIAASIFPIADIARNIGGDTVEVVQMLPTGASPHTYEPTTADIQRLQNIDAAFIIGEFEPFETQLFEGNMPSKVLNLHEYVDLLAYDNDEPGHEGSFDPHIWLSVENAKIFAEVIKTELIAINPEGKTIYEENYVTYLQELTQLQSELTMLVSTVENPRIVTFHEGFNYLAHDQGFEVLATIEPFPGKEPTPAYLAEVETIIAGNEVSVLFTEPQLSGEVVTVFSKEFKIDVYELDPLGGVGQRDSFIALMRYNVGTIVTALSHE